MNFSKTSNRFLLVSLSIGLIYSGFWFYYYFSSESKYREFVYYSEVNFFCSRFELVRVKKGYSYVLLSDSTKLIFPNMKNGKEKLSEVIVKYDSVCVTDTIIFYSSNNSSNEHFNPPP